MNKKTYLNKVNTIIYNSETNTSQNPVCELYYGDGYSRVLLQFDIDNIKSMFLDKTFCNLENLKHVLKMKNCWGLQSIDSKILLNSGKSSMKERTSSFYLHLVRVPEPWSSGSGNDYSKDGFLTNNYSFSENGSNWFNSNTQTPWSSGDGIYTGITSGNTNIVSTQLFEVGNEDIEIDITSEINNIITGSTNNNGYMLCYDELLEQTSTSITQYVGFFTNKTNTFFKPYLETIYSESIIDDRNEFYLDKDNKLYFYSIIGGQQENLDNIPTCTINNVEYTVKQATKGVYYIEINLSSDEYEPDEMIYDIWSNITYKGKTLKDVELEFVTKNSSLYYNLGNQKYEQVKYVPIIYGIKFGEKINKGQIIKIFVNPRQEYTTNTVKHIENMEYRVYVKETNKEITVIGFDKIHRTCNENYFTLFTDDLLPNKYYVDVKIKMYDTDITYKEKLMFEIVNEL